MASSDNRLESIGASKTIIARYVPGKDIIFSVPFKTLVTSKPSAIWMQGPTRIEPSERFITMVSERSASLTIKHVGKRDCGRYSCRLRDSVSDATVEFKLSLNHRPSPPRGPTQVSWKTKDTLVLQWKYQRPMGVL